MTHLFSNKVDIIFFVKNSMILIDYMEQSIHPL